MNLTRYTDRVTYSVISHGVQVLYTKYYDKALSKLETLDGGYIKVITTELIVKEKRI